MEPGDTPMDAFERFDLKKPSGLFEDVVGVLYERESENGDFGTELATPKGENDFFGCEVGIVPPYLESLFFCGFSRVEYTVLSAESLLAFGVGGIYTGPLDENDSLDFF